MSDFLAPFVSEFMGKAVTEAQPEPSDPIAPTQNDGDAGESERAGRWPDPLPKSTDPAEDPLNYPPTGRQVENTPTPLIGTVPFGGIVVDAGEIAGQALGGVDVFATIGDNGNARPGILGIYMWPMLGAATDVNVPRILSDGDGMGSLRRGAQMADPGVSFPMFLPLRRVNLLVPVCTAAAPAVNRVQYVVIGSNIGQSV